MASKMLVSTSNRMVHKVAEHIGVVRTGGRQHHIGALGSRPSPRRSPAVSPPHVSQACSGVGPDGKQVVGLAQNICVKYKQNFGERVVPSVLAQQLGDILYAYTSYSAYRPFGVHAMVAGKDEDTGSYELYLCQLDGTVTVRHGSGTRVLSPRAPWCASAGAGTSFVPRRSTPRRDAAEPQRYFGTAVGKGARSARTEIQKLKLHEMTCAEALPLIARM